MIPLIENKFRNVHEELSLLKMGTVTFLFLLMASSTVEAVISKTQLIGTNIFHTKEPLALAAT